MAVGANDTFFYGWGLGGESLVALIRRDALASDYHTVGSNLLALLDRVQVSRPNDHDFLQHRVRDARVHRHLRHHRPFVEVLVIEPSLAHIRQQLDQLAHWQLHHGLRSDAQ